MKRIAFCISGHLRCFDKLKQEFQELINDLHDGNDVKIDIYVVTWDKGDSSDSWSKYDKRMRTDRIEQTINGDYVKELFGDITGANFISSIIIDDHLYASEISPLLLRNFTSKSYNGSPCAIGANGVLHATRMLFLIWQCYCLMSFSGKDPYDLVIRTRPDIHYLRDKTYDAIANFLKMESYSELKIYSSLDKHYLSMSDIIFYGNQRSMEAACSAFLRLGQVYDSGLMFNPEQVLYKTQEIIGMEVIDIDIMQSISYEP